MQNFNQSPTTRNFKEIDMQITKVKGKDNMYNVQMSLGKLIALQNSLQRDKDNGTISTQGEEILEYLKQKFGQ